MLAGPSQRLLTLTKLHLPPPPAAGVPVPADAPFELTYLNARLPVAQEDELQQVGCGQLGLLGSSALSAGGMLHTHWGVDY